MAEITMEAKGEKMGYYTGYSLTVSGNNELAIIAELRSRYESAGYALTENGDTQDTCKWYDHETDLAYFSKQNPEALFTLNGNGEDSPDLWVKYFKNGKKQICKGEIVYPPVDESKLK
jgi:uncharacterized protein YuzE